MTYTHQSKELPKKYDHKETEKRLQDQWYQSGVYAWKNDLPREQTYVIDTPPPTVSGLLHMGHVFSYTQADFIARYQRMSGKDVFYPMGFDDNGLPTERLVEKVKKVQAHKYISEHGREAFIELCEGVAEEARQDFRGLFKSIALSVDWEQEYHTISDECRAISQLSFLDLYHKGEVSRKMEPMFWDPIDQTAIAQAELEERELSSHFNEIRFQVSGVGDQASVDRHPEPQAKDLSPHTKEDPSSAAPHQDDDNTETRNPEPETFIIGTTRPELIPACVAIFYHPDDERYQHLKGKEAITPLFGVRVPILEDEAVEIDKGTGIMMCCTFGDEADVEKWKKEYEFRGEKIRLPLRIVLNKYGKMDFQDSGVGDQDSVVRHPEPQAKDLSSLTQGDSSSATPHQNDEKTESRTLNPESCLQTLTGLKAKAARDKMIELLRESGDLVESKPITHMVKCAERSGAPIEILTTDQWFISILDKKDALKAKMNAATWYPEFMKLRMEQWIDGLKWDWCISRQRYFGVPFPVWYSKREGEEGTMLIAEPDQLPCNPLVDLPKGYSREEVEPDTDVMDTWNTSSVSPQLSSRGIVSFREEARSADDATQSQAYLDWTASLRSQNVSFIDPARHAKLFPADMRPQAHEIIRTWAFYTIVKAHLHQDTVPWRTLMISGWCLAEDKTKMSKSKGNVVTPVELIEEQGTDAVRYWASTSKLGTDTAFSTDLLKIGKKLVTKLWNATKFAAIHLEKLEHKPGSAAADVEAGLITEALDHWILSRLHRATTNATASFEKYEYSKAREAVEDFFWNDFCDNYLEMVKKRVYQGSDHRHPEPQVKDLSSQTTEDPSVAMLSQDDGHPESQTPNPESLSATHTIYHCLDGILRLFAPFVPHITEELHSHIFAAENAALGGSLHMRGSWPNAADYPVNEQAEQAGIAAVQILEMIRKAKSEAGVSIKFEIPEIALAVTGDNAPALDGIMDDLCAAGNVNAIEISNALDSANYTSEDQRFSAQITIENTEAA